MKQWNVLPIVMAVLAAGAAGAQTRKIDRVLTREFGEARREVLHEREINGLKVYDIRIHSEPRTTVCITELGDVMSRSMPVAADWLPRHAAAALRSMFRAEAHRVRKSEETCYLVDVMAGQRLVRLQLDPTGRLVNLYTRKQIIEAEDLSGLQALSRRDSHAVHELLGKYFENADVKQVFSHPDTEGFFVAQLTADDDHKGVVITMDARRDIVNWRSTIRAAELPRPVRETIAGMFHDAEVRHAQRSTDGFYSVEERVGEEELTIRIDATGDVLSVHAKDRENLDSADAG